MALVNSELFRPMFLRFALREMRGGLQGFYIFLACLALGVAAIAGVGSVGAAIEHGMQSEGQAILGGDVAVELNYREASADELRFFQKRGAVSLNHDMRVMVKNSASDARSLAELKAVDAAYPLFGQLILAERGDLHALLAKQVGVWGAVMEAALSERLNAKLGEMLRIGAENYQLRGIIAREPDRASGGIGLAPRIMVAGESLQSAQLIQPGSLVMRRYRIKLAPGTNLENWISDLNREFPEAAWRVRQHTDSAPGTRRFFEQMSLFLNLSALTALVAGGVGAGNAVHGYLQRKRTAIAVLKCIGASGPVIFGIYMAQILLLALFAIGIGLSAGAAIPFVLKPLLADLLPIPAHFTLYPLQLVYAAAFGMGVAVIFAIWPLAQAREISAAELFRALIIPAQRWPRKAYLTAMAFTVLFLMWLAFASAGNARFAGWFVLGVCLSFLALSLLGRGLVRLAALLPRPARTELRLALGNLHRPGSLAPAILLSLGLGLSLLTVISAVEGNITHQIQSRAARLAPSFFFLDIQSADIDAFLNLAKSDAGVSNTVAMPSLRGRITRINGAKALAENIAPEARWALSGDRVMSYAAAAPANALLSEGAWWPAFYAGPPLLSLDADLAKGMGLRAGDRLSVNVLGREVEARIANLRRIDWSEMQVNFALIFSPGAFAGAPHSYLATAHATPAAEKNFYKAVTGRFPGVSVMRVKETVETVNALLGNLAMAVRAAGSVTLLTGILVLAGALAAGNARRVYDAVVLKVLGAARNRVLTAYALEYAMLGLAAAILASGIGTLAAYFIVTELMRAEFVFLPSTVLMTVGLSLIVTVSLGLAVTWRALGQKPAGWLRALD